MNETLAVLRSVLGWWLLIGSLMAGGWLWAEVRLVAAKRRTGSYRLLAWYEYPLAVLGMIALWPFFVAMVIDAALARKETP